MIMIVYGVKTRPLVCSLIWFMRCAKLRFLSAYSTTIGNDLLPRLEISIDICKRKL